MQMLQWLENPAVEDGPLRAQLKAFAVQYSSRHRISDGTGVVQLMGLSGTRKGQKQNCNTNSTRMQTSDLALGVWSRHLVASHQAQWIFQGLLPIAQARNSVLAVVLKDEHARTPLEQGHIMTCRVVYHLLSVGRRSL